MGYRVSASLPRRKSIIATKKPEPALSEPIASPVMPVGKWREQERMEKAAGFTEDKSMLISEVWCDACEIFIGRDHEEQELYFYPLLRQRAKLRRGRRYYEHAVFHLCGDCARSRGLPESMQFFGHSVWQTRRIILQQEVAHAEELLYVRVLELWKQRPIQEMPDWSWWSKHIPPLVSPPVQQPEQPEQPEQQLTPPVALVPLQVQVQDAIHDIDSLLQALSVMRVPTLLQQAAS